VRSNPTERREIVTKVKVKPGNGKKDFPAKANKPSGEGNPSRDRQTFKRRRTVGG